MSDFSLGARLRVSDDVVFRELDGEAVILNLGSGTYFGLDEVGTRAWALIEAHGDLRAVYDTLLDEYDVPPDVLERDLIRLVSEMAGKGLVMRSDDANPS